MTKMAFVICFWNFQTQSIESTQLELIHRWARFWSSSKENRTSINSTENRINKEIHKNLESFSTDEKNWNRRILTEILSNVDATDTDNLRSVGAPDELGAGNTGY